MENFDVHTKDLDKTPYRAWCAVLNNYFPDELEELKKVEATYSIIGEEVGEEEGTPHLQMYFYFNSKKSLKQLKRINYKIHWEPAKGNTLHNYKYCSKEGKFYEQGERPKTQEEKGALGKRAYEDAWGLAKAGHIEEVDVGIRVRLYSTLKKIKKDYQPKLNNIDTLKGEWYWGPTGSGKSLKAGVGTDGVYRKDANNKWWDGYDGEKVAVIDELMPLHAKDMGYYLKIWGDHYPFMAEMKGSGTMARPEKVIVTSQYQISDLFDDKETIQALKRRYKEVQFFSGE